MTIYTIYTDMQKQQQQTCRHAFETDEVEISYDRYLMVNYCTKCGLNKNAFYNTNTQESIAIDDFDDCCDDCCDADDMPEIEEIGYIIQKEKEEKEEGGEEGEEEEGEEEEEGDDDVPDLINCSEMDDNLSDTDSDLPPDLIDESGNVVHSWRIH